MSASQIIVPDWLREGRSAEELRLRNLLLQSDDVSLEALAQEAHLATRRHFGRTVTLYAPLYLSNFCSSGCVYCGFAANGSIKRRKLDANEIEEQLDQLSKLGFEDVLLLTGERTAQADIDYVAMAVSLAARRFHSVNVETFPMSVAEYRRLVDAGVIGVTVYQETYDPDVYAAVHPSGKKRDYLWRLAAPARALEAGMRQVGLGVLVGLADPVSDIVALARHVRHVQKHFWHAGIALSLPRLRPALGNYRAPYPTDDKTLARCYMALRCVFSDIPLVLSTRESPAFRDGMARVGVTRMSVASRTDVGGYGNAQRDEDQQFEVSDNRDVDSFCRELRVMGMEPVFKNWDVVYRGPQPERERL